MHLEGILLRYVGQYNLFIFKATGTKSTPISLPVSAAMANKTLQYQKPEISFKKRCGCVVSTSPSEDMQSPQAALDAIKKIAKS